MRDWAAMSTGERLRYLRGALTQEALAERANVSVWTLRTLEQDRAGRTSSVATLLRLATALDTDIAVLTGQRSPNHRETTADRQTLAHIIDALVSPDDFHDIPGLSAPSTPAEPNVEALENVVDRARRLYWHGDYTALTSTLTPLITEARATVEACAASDRHRAHAVLAAAYKLACDVANQMGDQRLAFLALDRAYPAARKSGDPLLLARLSGTLSWVYLRRGKLRAAEDVCRATAEAIEPRLGKAKPAHLAVWGDLLVSAAVAASRAGDAAKHIDAWEYMSMAHAAAQRLGRDTDHYETMFGPTQAQIQAVGVAVATRDIGRALDLERHIVLPDTLTTARKARYLIDVAHARLLARQDNAATETLLNVGAFASGWMRHQSLAVELVGQLARRDRAGVAIRDLARAIGAVRQ